MTIWIPPDQTMPKNLFSYGVDHFGATLFGFKLHIECPVRNLSCKLAFE